MTTTTMMMMLMMIIINFIVGSARERKGNHLSSTTCLMHVFFKSGEHFGKLW